MNKTEVLAREEAVILRSKKLLEEVSEVNHEMATLKNWSYKCIECKQRTKATFSHEIRKKMISRELCFDCLFWHKHVDSKDLPISVRVNGQHYRIADEFAKGNRGHASAKFIVLFNDGRRVITTNLWSQGEIPSRFKERLPDNATFE